MISQSAIHSPKAPVPQRMADFIISHTAANESVTLDDLRLQFSSEDIEKHFPAAFKLALAQATRQ